MSTEDELREVVNDLVWQFGYRVVNKGRPSITSGGLSALEDAFDTLGWDDPHFLDEDEQKGATCEIAGCVEFRVAGARWDGLYVGLCSSHSSAQFKGEARPPAVKAWVLVRESQRDERGVLAADATW